MEALNFHLRPAPVAITACARVDDAFHARFSARERRYTFRLVARRAPVVHDAGLVWQVRQPLNLEAMRQGAAHLIGRHDFSTFRASGAGGARPHRMRPGLPAAGAVSDRCRLPGRPISLNATDADGFGFAPVDLRPGLPPLSPLKSLAAPGSGHLARPGKPCPARTLHGSARLWPACGLARPVAGRTPSQKKPPPGRRPSLARQSADQARAPWLCLRAATSVLAVSTATAASRQ